MAYALGFDYGTESVRVLVVDVQSGRIAGQATQAYTHGVIDRTLPEIALGLPGDFALQHPRDWLADLAAACRTAMTTAKISADHVVGIGVDFTSCTVLPTLQDGTPLSETNTFRGTPLAWPKLWKHHGAKAAVERINTVARQRKESFLSRYGGSIGVEWFFPKVLETITDAPAVAAAAEVWIEAGDWLVWQLVSGPFPHCDAAAIVRSTCQAGYKGMWNRVCGFPSREFLAAVHPDLPIVVEKKMPGTLRPPGVRAGTLTPAAANLLGLKPGTPVGAAIIDAHAGVPGSGVAEAGTVVLVMGTSACQMLNARTEMPVPGIAGVVEEGILPGFFGYETGQASVGDAFGWLVKTFELSHAELGEKASALKPGSGGVLAIDWLNGCRTPLMDPCLSGGFVGLTLSTRPEQLYRALMEATAFGLRWIVESLRTSGVPVTDFVASGGLPAKSPLLMQIYADVLRAPIRVAASDQSVALGAAILGAVAAGDAGHPTMHAAVKAMAPQENVVTYRPKSENAAAYDAVYRLYRYLTGDKALLDAMRSLATIR